MRIALNIALLYVALGLQYGLSAQIQVWGATPNLVLPAVAFVALSLPTAAAPILAILAGLGQDLISPWPIGSFGLAYGLLAYAAKPVARGVTKSNTFSYTAAYTAGGAVLTLAVLIVGWMLHPSQTPFGVLFREFLYTLVLGVGLAWGLSNGRTWFRVVPEGRG